MGSKASLRKIDNLGRIVIPRDIRKALEINEWDDLSISLVGNRIIIQREKPECTFCQAGSNLLPFKDKYVCKKCLENLSSSIN